MSAVTHHAYGVLSHAIAQPALLCTAGASLGSFTAHLPALSAAASNALHAQAKSTEALAACAHSGSALNCACATCCGASNSLTPKFPSHKSAANAGVREAAQYMAAARHRQRGAGQVAALLHASQGAGSTRLHSSAATAQCTSARAPHSGAAACGCIRCSFHRASWQGSLSRSTAMDRWSRHFSTVDEHHEKVIKPL